MRTLLLPLVVGLALGTAPAGAQAAGAQAAARPPADSGRAAVPLQPPRALLAQGWQTSATLTAPAELARTKAAFLPLLARDSTGALAHRLLGVPPQVRLATLPDA